MAIWKLLSETVAIRHFPSGRGDGPQLAARTVDDPRMEGVSLNNVNGSQPAPLDHAPREPLKKAVSQDEASALALLVAMPAPQLATAGILGTQLDCWA